VKLRDADKEIFMVYVSVSHYRKGDLKSRSGASSNIQSTKKTSVEIFCSYTQVLISSHSVSLENNEKADVKYSSTFFDPEKPCVSILSGNRYGFAVP
jgi:hypothetical protein